MDKLIKHVEQNISESIHGVDKMVRVFNIYLMARRMLPIFLLAAILVSARAADLGLGGPSITIISPTNGSTVSAGNVTISVHVDDFSLVNKLGQANVAGEGHIHYFMDVKIPTAPGKPALTAVGTYVPTINTSYTWMNVKPGIHNFSVELVNNDHTPLNPPQYSEINVTVAASSSASASAANAAKSGGYGY
jgi:hypothetical protein